MMIFSLDPLVLSASMGAPLASWSDAGAGVGLQTAPPSESLHGGLVENPPGGSLSSSTCLFPSEWWGLTTRNRLWGGET